MSSQACEWKEEGVAASNLDDIFDDSEEEEQERESGQLCVPE